jgi:poly [ADP-ribose] polymerase
MYFSLIPHDFGYKKPPTIATPKTLKKELDLLDSLSDMKIADDIMKSVKDAGIANVNHLDRQFQNLNLTELTPLDSMSDEYNELKGYLTGTQGFIHAINYGKVEIFRLERNGEFERFEKSDYAKLKKSDRRLLWHGSRATNFGGILSAGLRIAPPEAPVNGYMFSKGIYMADMSTKSANYCMAHNSGGEGLLLLCEAELGSPMLELTHFDYEADIHAKAKGAISTFGKGSTGPRKWKDAKCVHKALKGVKMVSVQCHHFEI